MKLEEVINASLTYLNETDYVEGADRTDNDKVRLLARCANIMLAERAQEYLPFTDG